MPSLTRLIAAVVALVVPVLASAQLVPLTPDVDPFYIPPAGYASTVPGTVLRQRPIVASSFGLVAQPIEAYQLLYRTTAIDGTPIATVTTVFKPLVAQPGKLVSFFTAEDSSAFKCAPSYNYQYLAQQSNLVVSIEFLLIQAYLQQGYVVASPDYEGPDNAFAPGHLEGQLALDGIRAVNNYMKVNNAVVGVGYSGGAIASGWAAALQKSYAPELNVKGWIAGGTPANLTSVLEFLDGTVAAGLLPAAVNGMLAPSTYGAELTPLINTYITDKGRQILANAKTQCAPDNIIQYNGIRILDYPIQSLGPNLPYQPQVAAVLSKNTLGTDPSETPIAPIYLVHASEDEIIPYSNVSTLYDHWCADGASVRFTTYASGGHATTEIFSVVPTIQWANAAFAGTLPKGCSKDTVYSNQLDPLALGLNLEPILVNLVSAAIEAEQADSGNTAAFATNVS